MIKTHHFLRGFICGLGSSICKGDVLLPFQTQDWDKHTELQKLSSSFRDKIQLHKWDLGCAPHSSPLRTSFWQFQNLAKGRKHGAAPNHPPPTLALMWDAQPWGRLCHCLFSRLAASSQGLSVSYFSGAGPDQYCILSDLSKPSGEGNHQSVAPCSFWSRSIPRQRGALFLLQL